MSSEFFCPWPGLTLSYPSQISRPGFHILLIAKYNIMNLIKERSKSMQTTVWQLMLLQDFVYYSMQYNSFH